MLGGGGDEVSIMPVVFCCGTVIVSSFGSFLSVVSSSKIYHPSIPISLGVHHIQEYFKKIIGGGSENSLNHRESPGMRSGRSKLR